MRSISYPEGWCSAPLGILLPLNYGKGLTARQREAGEYIVYGSNGPIGTHKLAITSRASIVVGRKGAVGSVYFAESPCWVIDTAYYSEDYPHIYLKFYCYFLKYFQLDRLDRSTAIPSLSRDDYSIISAPLPPYSEQVRIAKAIDAQLKKLDSAITGLQRIKANLKRYRASVLQAAVEGRLTAEWRKQNPPSETGEQLLARILKERRAKWEENQLKKYVLQGKTPPKNWKDKYPEPVKPDTTGLPELPDGWVWATIDQAVLETANGFGKREQKVGTPNIVLRLADVSSGEINYSNTRKINATINDIERYNLLPGDLLTIRVNGSPELVGRLVYTKGFDRHVLYCDHFIRLRLGEITVSKWVRLNGDTQRFRKHIELNKVSSAGQNTISQSSLVPFELPLPSSDEVIEIETEVSCRLSIADATENTVDSALQRVARLRQSILKRAFEGRLVPQDPNDEPASALLERIRAERIKQAATVKPARTKRKGKDQQAETSTGENGIKGAETA